MAYAGTFATVGALALAVVARAQVTPMALALGGGFMLIGPALLAGFFRLADIAAAGATPRVGHALSGFRDCPRDLWVVALVCVFLFLIWITDAATLYGFMVGRRPQPAEWARLIMPGRDVAAFTLWSSVMGAALAFVVYAISAFSVPLMYYRRAGLVAGVNASVQAVFRNFGVSVAWALLLAAATMLSILLLPLFLVVFPLLAYASQALYREVFPA